MRVETKQVYYADDGTVFDDETACKKYEDSIRERASRTSYWVVHHSPDLTEGRGYCGIAYLEAYIPVDYPALKHLEESLPLCRVSPRCLHGFSTRSTVKSS
jgi:hypothetical protein